MVHLEQVEYYFFSKGKRGIHHMHYTYTFKAINKIIFLLERSNCSFYHIFHGNMACFMGIGLNDDQVELINKLAAQLCG